ncbi:MAG: hypothetical protein NTW21_38215 [Verrucomicrobia bacterium]|nr:hypothetical protein [Verrucomicrobiota bacterium]
MNRHIAIIVAMGLMAMGPSSQAQHEDWATTATPSDGFHLGTRRNDETGKASFLLNGQPFYPFVYYENFRDVTPKFLTQLRAEGFHSIQLAIDACDAGSEDLQRVLQLLHRAWMFSLADAADSSNAVKPTTGKAGSLKLSLGINKGQFEIVSETWHGFFDDVLMASGIRVDLPVTVSCYILPNNEQMNTLHLILKQQQGAAESTEVAACAALIPARRSDRLRLVAAQHETAASINWVRIAELKRKQD